MVSVCRVPHLFAHWSWSHGEFSLFPKQASKVLTWNKQPARYFLSKDGFFRDHQRIIVWVYNPSKSHGSPCRAREEHYYRRERCQEGYSKQRFYSFSLTESLPGKKRSLSSSWTLIWSQGMRGPCSSLLILFNWGFSLLLFLLLFFTIDLKLDS